jgi:hypothetical protein
MKRVIIRNLEGIQTHGAELLDPQAWIDNCIANNYWGKAERWIPASEPHDEAGEIAREQREIAPAMAATIDEEGGEVSPAVPAVIEDWVLIRAEYTIEIEDISAQLEQERINKEALEYLASTDWLIIREIDAGIPCPADIKQARAEARARIVR